MKNEQADFEIVAQIQSDSRVLSKEEYAQLANEDYLKFENKIIFETDEAVIEELCSIK